MPSSTQEKWSEYKKEELEHAGPILCSLGYKLQEEQVHAGGERYLMTGVQDVGGGGYKLVLMGERISDGKKVVIKVSSNPKGIKEIIRERQSRETIKEIRFAYKTLRAPKEILFIRKQDVTIFITEYITEERPLLTRTLKEQFSLVTEAFETQEGVHATTHAHAKQIKDIFGIMGVDAYVGSMKNFAQNAVNANPAKDMGQALENAVEFFLKNKQEIDRYGDFLTHADFVPHNLRVHDDTIYLLDFASVHFGNKYESWARFINYMTLYNPELAQALLSYVKQNRCEGEYRALQSMRVYKLAFLLRYYSLSLEKTSGDLYALTQERLQFWTTVLEHTLADKPVPNAIILRFRATRDLLRSDEEKQRQKELNQLL